jgi:protein transport protein SEC61 subunit gamma-like protein
MQDIFAEFLKITQAVAMGFAALGALGYFVKVSNIKC